MQLHPYEAVSPLYDRVERHPVIDVTHLCRSHVIDRRVDCDGGGLAPSTLARIEVIYRRWENQVRILSTSAEPQTIALEWTPCRFGGERPWFVCPSCTSKRLKLHRVGRRWACRRCHGLKYESQRLRPGDRGLLRAHRIRASLRTGPYLLLGPLPPKPRHMRWKRYLSLEEKAHEAERVFLAELRRPSC